MLVAQIVRQQTPERSRGVGALRLAGLEIYVTDNTNARMTHVMVLMVILAIGSAWQLILHGRQ